MKHRLHKRIAWLGTLASCALGMVMPLEGLGQQTAELVLQQSTDLQNWDDVAVTAEMLTAEGSLQVENLPEGFFFRLEVTEVGSEPAPAGFSHIPAGSFMMGDSFDEGDSDELPVHEVAVSGFYLQQTEVTNAQMAEVLNWAIEQGLATASSSTVENSEGDAQELLDLDEIHSEISWDGSELVVDSGKENHPVVEVTWYGAMAYGHYLTRWEGGLTQAVDLSDWSFDLSATGYRLPTEAEWEKAARGGATGERYPFGNAIDSTLANYDGNEGGTVAVGSYPATGYGLYDMAGNVREWCADWYGSGFYSNSPGVDPTGPASGSRRVRRGGSLGNRAQNCRSATRSRGSPGFISGNADGFRAARSE